MTQDHIFALDWKLLPHAAYSPDMAPSDDYYLFQSLQHHLADTHFMSFEEIRKYIDLLYRFEAGEFVSSRNLPERWQKVVDANREYFAD